MDNFNREFQVFVKPVGALCNLNCTYCYYLDKAKLNDKKEPVLMSDELLEKYIIQHLETSSEKTILFSWHGGEPTIAGIDFYKRVVELQKKHQNTEVKIINGIQTNGTKLNDEWCHFLSDSNFIVGLSIDGPVEMHNKYRVTNSESGSFSKGLNAYELLKKYNITTEILCVINEYNVNYPLEVYRFFKSIDAKFISFLPLVIRKVGFENKVTSNSVSANSFGDFLIEIFDEWLEQDIGKIKIQLFEEAFRTAFNQDHTLCIFKKTCGAVPVIELNGDFYSCDHFVDKDHLIGNISNTHLINLLEDKKQIAFGQAKFNSLPKYCLNCEVLPMCNGECPKNRFIKSPTGEKGLNYLCKGYQKFFKHCQPFILAISSIWENQC